MGDDTRIEKFRELSDAEIDSASVEGLRAAYRALLAHRVVPRCALWSLVSSM